MEPSVNSKERNINYTLGPAPFFGATTLCVNMKNSWERIPYLMYNNWKTDEITQELLGGKASKTRPVKQVQSKVVLPEALMNMRQSGSNDQNKNKDKPVRKVKTEDSVASQLVEMLSKLQK